jgi:hypothetical protein
MRFVDVSERFLHRVLVSGDRFTSAFDAFPHLDDPSLLTHR